MIAALCSCATLTGLEPTTPGAGESGPAAEAALTAGLVASAIAAQAQSNNAPLRADLRLVFTSAKANPGAPLFGLTRTPSIREQPTSPTAILRPAQASRGKRLSLNQNLMVNVNAR